MRMQKQVAPGFKGPQVPISSLPCSQGCSFEVLGMKSGRQITLAAMEGVQTGRNNEKLGVQ